MPCNNRSTRTLPVIGIKQELLPVILGSRKYDQTTRLNVTIRLIYITTYFKVFSIFAIEPEALPVIIGGQKCFQTICLVETIRLICISCDFDYSTLN